MTVNSINVVLYSTTSPSGEGIKPPIIKPIPLSIQRDIIIPIHVKYLETTHQIKHLSREYKSYFEYGYMTSYAMLLAVLVFFALSKQS